MKDWLIMSNKPSKSSKLKKGHLQTSTFYWHNQYYETTLSGLELAIDLLPQSLLPKTLRTFVLILLKFFYKLLIFHRDNDEK